MAVNQKPNYDKDRLQWRKSPVESCLQCLASHYNVPRPPSLVGFVKGTSAVSVWWMEGDAAATPRCALFILDILSPSFRYAPSLLPRLPSFLPHGRHFPFFVRLWGLGACLGHPLVAFESLSVLYCCNVGTKSPKSHVVFNDLIYNKLWLAC